MSRQFETTEAKGEKLYRENMQAELLNTPNLTLLADAAEEILYDTKATAGNAGGDKRITGVLTASGKTISCGALVVTTGTFLRGLIHKGEEQIPAGRVGEKPSVGLAQSLEKLGLPMGRLKTGTPARLDGKTINWNILEEQKGDNPPQPFSFLNTEVTVPQISCHITYTNEKTHEVIRNNLTRSAMYSGRIKSTGPRYCPSIEDKVVRFADRESHQIFLEPEGRTTLEYYCNGISTSLPRDVQEAVIPLIPGLEDAEIMRYGYAVEYDYVDPRVLDDTLQVQSVPGVFFVAMRSSYSSSAA